MVLKKKHRMSMPVVAIGWLLLIPSFIGIMIGIVALMATGKAASSASGSIDNTVRAQLEAAKIPDSIVAKAIAGDSITDAEKSSLTDDQRQALSDGSTSLTASRIGAGAGTAIAGGASIGIIVIAFIGGLLGWLLVMKKKVLQCPACSAVVAAS